FRVTFGDAAAPAFGARAFACEFTLGNDGQRGLEERKATLQRGDGDGQLPRLLLIPVLAGITSDEGLPGLDQPRLQPSRGKLFEQRLAATGRIGGDQDEALRTRIQPVTQARGKSAGRSATDGKIRRRFGSG